MRRKNNLDEMQEMELLKIEHNGCWLAFWLLLASIIVQSIAIKDMNLQTLAGEWIVFMILALYLGFACLRKGIWDRRIPMTGKANVITSLVAGGVVGVFNAIMIYRNYPNPMGTLAAALFVAIITFVICLIALTISLQSVKKRQAEIEAEPSDADEI